MFNPIRSQTAPTTENHTQKKTFTYSEKSEQARARYLEEIKEIPQEKRVYTDESGINRPLIRERGRAVRGVKVEDVRRGRKFQRLNVVAAQFELPSGEVKRVAPLCYTQNMTGEFFEDWFRKTLVKSIAKGSTIIMDNASFHRKKRLKNLARRHGMKVLFLPPYSPDFNPIEKTWACMKRALIDIIADTECLKAEWTNTSRVRIRACSH